MVHVIYDTLSSYEIWDLKGIPTFVGTTWYGITSAFNYKDFEVKLFADPIVIAYR